MAVSADAALRDHLMEVGDSSHPILVRPVQHRNVKVRETDVLVRKQEKRLHFQEGWDTDRLWLAYTTDNCDYWCCCRCYGAINK